MKRYFLYKVTCCHDCPYAESVGLGEGLCAGPFSSSDIVGKRKTIWMQNRDKITESCPMHHSSHPGDEE
ncbi:MAG: hypothetical protein KGI11_09060 [Thaumarchaeota archaeon]|nr:hypothetical protein [Nitrososphaerota archaeon]